MWALWETHPFRGLCLSDESMVRFKSSQVYNRQVFDYRRQPHEPGRIGGLETPQVSALPREPHESFSKGPPGPPRTDTRLNDCMIIGVRLSLVWAGSRQSTLAAHLGRLKSHKQTFLLNAFGVGV